MKWSGEHHRRKKKDHIHPENGQTTWNGQVVLREGRRTTTYKLRMGGQHGMVRMISRKEG
jgi:hypothetical protein